MWRGVRWVVWVWVWAGLTCHTLTHSTYEDPHLNPRKSDVLTTNLQQGNGGSGRQDSSLHLALELHGGEDTAKILAHKYKLQYVRQVFSDPPIYHFLRPANPTNHNHYHYRRYHHHYIHDRRRRSLRDTDLVHQLASEPGVKWVNQQKAKYRDKRDQLHGFRPLNYPRGSGESGRRYTDRTMRMLDNNMRLQPEENEFELLNNIVDTLWDKKINKSPAREKINVDTKSFWDDVLPESSNVVTKERYPTSHNEARTNYEENSSDDSPRFNDPLYKLQWYLHNTGQLGKEGHDLNVTGAWRQGYTGHGITICILDDGFQTTNQDLAANYNPAISYSVVHDGQNESDPSPRLDPPLYSNSHGTYCAGAVAAVANNGVCGVGLAYNASVGGVRVLDGAVTDVQEATALSRHVNEVTVFSASWGPKDDGTHVDGPGKLARRALLQGIQKGRRGLGTIYVWASGNGGIFGDNCSLDGYASSIYTLTVSALTDTGMSTFYSEPCASALAGVFVGGQHTLQEALDTHHIQLRVVVPELDGHCTNKFQGSSAAAPLMAGVIALVLQANPNLTWRDVQHLVVAEAAPTPAALTEDDWHTNAMGKKFHLLQGFGAINAGRMVEAALTWQNVGPQVVKKLVVFQGESDLTSGWRNVSQKLREVSPMTAVEQVVATITLNHPQRNKLNIYIVSPSGTESQVLTHRFKDNSTSGFHGWGFMSVHLWGEPPRGVWTVALKCDSNLRGSLLKVDLTVYGN